MKYTGPKVKLSRRLGIPMTPKAAKVMEKKPYGPGQHGRGGRYGGKMSDYKRQLLEKQKLRFQYNIHERQMLNYYKKAAQKSGNTSDNLIQLLESRLDSVVYRSGLAPTIYAARQIVNHGHILVNGKQVNLPAYQVQVDDVVTVKEKSRRMEVLQSSLRKAHPPKYLDLNKPTMTVKLQYLPLRDEVPVECEMSSVIELYSR
ncbi:30S ribosomal protein S4 [candidate division KSB1 bacterium]|nr:30S ribosomal protein S4 [candidate division KSB1 bacterium]